MRGFIDALSHICGFQYLYPQSRLQFRLELVDPTPVKLFA